MAATTNELTLLERVFLRLGSAETDEQLQASIYKFLPPVLLKLSSTQEGVRTKVMELLIHINKRLKNRPQVQLPVETLLLQYQDATAHSFMLNFAIIYIKLGYPRMEMSKQAELVPIVLNAIEGKPTTHQDGLMLIIMPALGHIKVPTDPDKRASLLRLQDKRSIAKQLLQFMLDMLLLPYGAVGQTDTQKSGGVIDWSHFSVPSGLSEYAFKRVIGETPPTAEQLEQIKLGVVKFLAAGFFSDVDILIHLIVAAADTRFSVANMADLELKKIVSTLDWSSMEVVKPLYELFLGSDAIVTQKELKPQFKRLPAGTRIRLKLLQYFCRVTKGGFIIPLCIQIIFNSLYGENTNAKLKSLALQFASNITEHCCLVTLSPVAGILLIGVTKLIFESDNTHKPMAYRIIGHLGRRIPSLINSDLSLLRKLFNQLVSTEGEIRQAVKDTLISITSAFVLKKDEEDKMVVMNAELLKYSESPEFNVRYVAIHYAVTIFPLDDVPSRYLLLLACGDDKHEINSEAMKALYGVTFKNDNIQSVSDKIPLPGFVKLLTYIYTEMQSRISKVNTRENMNKQLPYNVTAFSGIIIYLRVCLARDANIPAQQPLQHPCEHTALIGRYLEKLYNDQPEIINNYVDMILLLSHHQPDVINLTALLEVFGSVPHYVIKKYEKELPWLYSLLTCSKKDIRELAAKIYALLIVYFSKDDFERDALGIMDMINKKNLEAQHGALVTLIYMMESKLVQLRNIREIRENLSNWVIYENIVKKLCAFLHSNELLLMEAAVQAVGILGKTYSLPLPAESENQLDKRKIVETLFSILSNAKMNTKMKENAALSLGYLCVGECFPYTTDIANKIVATAKETKDIEIHLILGEALVCCVQGQASPEARDAWTTLPIEHTFSYSSESNELLVHILDELFNIYQVPHPNLRQAVCVWLFALLKHNVQRECMQEKLSAIHHVFIDFLSEDNDIVQDIASKGLSFVHANSKKENRDALVSNILDQFIQGRRTVQQVTADTKLFEEGQLGKSPSGGNLSTYREICSLATELQKPELVYYFMRLANHNAIWTSKKGAAVGFAAIADIAKDELDKYLPTVIPRLYRYQFDPTPKIQQSMISIWRAIVPSTIKAIEQYHKEILTDVTDNLTNKEWRVRISCCNALADLLKTNVQFNFIEYGPELWKKLFLVMDDIHEGTRLAATNTASILSKVCIRRCESLHPDAEKEVQVMLPILVDIGITHTVDVIRAVSLQTVSQLASTAGASLKPSLGDLIPSLLESIGNSEHPKLTYLSNVCSTSTRAQEAVDDIRVNVAKGHHATETTTKCIQYIDADILKILMPKIIDLIKCSVGFGTKIACSHFIILLNTHLKTELQPYSGKVLTALVNGLSDRNVAVKKHNAIAIGHIVGSVKDSSLDKLFNVLYTRYMEHEDDAIRLAIGQTLQSINNHNPEKLRNYQKIVIPLTFFAMHAEKIPGNENLIELWTDLWNDITPGTEAGISQNLPKIVDILRSALASRSWTTKAQAANAVYTIALKAGDNIDSVTANVLLNTLADNLHGRTWDGKQRLLKAFAMLACNSKKVLEDDSALLNQVVTVLHNESKKGFTKYHGDALQAFAMVLDKLNIDKFAEVYEIVRKILTTTKSMSNLPEGIDDEDSVGESGKNTENKKSLQEIAYEVLGKTWPSSKKTQDKYCLQFIDHCHKVMQNNTRSVQVAILIALNTFVDKLLLLRINQMEMTSNDKELLKEVFYYLNKIISYSLSIPKFTILRKEALNIILSLVTRLHETNSNEQLDIMKLTLKEFLPDLVKDNQPEIRTRITDIKEILKF